MGLRDRLSSLDKRDTVNAAGTSQISTESGGIRSRLNAARKEKEIETNYKPDISRFVSGYAGLIKQFNDGLNSTEKYASRNTNDESSSISGKILSANLNMQESTVNDMLNDLAKNRENYAKAIGTDRITEIENNLRQIGEFTKSERDISAESNDKVKRSVQGFNSIQGPYKSNADYENALKHFTENADKNNEIIQDANAARTSGPLLDAEGQKLISETQQLHPFGTFMAESVDDRINEYSDESEYFGSTIRKDRLYEIEKNSPLIGDQVKTEKKYNADKTEPKEKEPVSDNINENINENSSVTPSEPHIDKQTQNSKEVSQKSHPYSALPLKPETIADYDIYPHYGNSDAIETPLDRINATDGRILPGSMDDEDRINYMAGESKLADYEALKPFDNLYKMFAERGAPKDEQDRLIITRGLIDTMSQLKELYDDENSPTSEMAHEYMDMFDKLFVKYSDSNYVLDQLITGMKTAVGGYAGLGYGIQNTLMGGKPADDSLVLDEYFNGTPQSPESSPSLDGGDNERVFKEHQNEYNTILQNPLYSESTIEKVSSETGVSRDSIVSYFNRINSPFSVEQQYENTNEYVSKPAKVVGKIASQVGQQLPSWVIGGAYGAAFSGASEAASLTEHIVNAFKGGGIKEIGTGLITAAKGNMTTNLMGLSAAGNRLTENLSKYGSTPEAYAEAAINGFFESFTEGLFGYSDAAGLGKVLSTTGASKIENVLKTLTNYLINSGEEGLEEVVNVPLQGLAEKALINNDKPWVGDGGVFDAREMISNGVDGALMGAVLGSVGVITGSISNIGNAEQIRTAAEALNQVNKQLPDEYKLKEINTSRATVEDVERFSAELLKAQQQIVADDYLDNIDALIESGMESPAGTDSRIIAEKLQEKINSGVKITSEDALELAEANYRQVNFENSSDEQNGMDALYAAYSDNPTDENSQALTSAIEEAGDLGEALLDTSKTRYETGENITEPTDLSGIDKAKTPVPGALSIMPSDIQHVVVNGNEVKYVTKAGDVVSAKEVDLGSSDNVLFGEYTKGMSSEDANEMISAYRDYGGDIDPRVFGSEWRHIRNVGRTGALKTHAAYSDFDASFGEELKAIAYNQGLQERAREAAKIKQKNNVEDKARQIVEKRKKASKTGGKGVVNDSALKRSGASNRAQNAAMKYSRALARFGYNVTFFNDSVIIDGKKHKANGAYDAETNTIYLRCDTRFKGTDIRGVLGQTLSHEIVHSIQAWNKEGYDELCDYIRQALPDDIERLIRDKMEGLNLDYSEAFDEVIADGCEMMLKDSETVAKMARENYGLFTKVKQAIDDFIKRLTHVQKELYIDTEGRDSGEIHEAAKALRAALSDFKEMQAIFDKAFEGTLKNMSEGFGIESEKNSISEDTTTHEDKSEERKAEKGKSNTPSKTEKANKTKKVRHSEEEDEFTSDKRELVWSEDAWSDKTQRDRLIDDLEAVAQNQTDRLFISRLREEAINANTYEAELSTIQREIQEIKFTSGSDRTRLPDLEKKRSALEAAIINSDRKLYGYRNGQVYKRLAERSTRAIINNQKSIVSKRSEESYRNELYGKIIKKIDAIMTLSESTTKGKHMPSSMKHTVNLLREGMFHAPAYMKMAAQTQRNIDETEMELKGAKANAAAAQNDIEIRGSNEIALAKLKKYNDYISRLEDKLISLRKKVKDYESKSLEAAKNATDIVNQFSAMNDEIFDENVNSKVAELIKMLNGRLLFTLTIEEMETFNDTMTMMNKAISNAKKAFISGRGIAEMAYDVALEIKRNDRAYTKAELVAKKMKDFLKYGMMKPWELFESSSSPTLIKLYRNLQKGEGDYGRLIKKYSAAYRDIAESHGIKQSDFQKKITTERLSYGRELELTVGEVMSLYALSRRAQGSRHLISDMFGQGFLLKGDIIKEKVSTGKPNAYEYKYRTDSKPVKITDNDIKGIIKKLSNEQKAFVEAVQKYMSTELADDGNRVSMLMYDVRIFNEKFYFPIKIAYGYNIRNATENKANDENPKIKNKGFTKELIDNATAPILIESFDQAWAGHANEMATYSALALPLDDMDRVIHYIEKDSLPENKNEGRVSLSIPLELGKKFTSAVRDFINDVNGGVRSEDSIFSSKLISLNKAAKVMANIRVAIQQPAAIIRACALIDPKYLLGFSTKGMSDTAKMKLYDEMIKYTSTAVIKELGGVDIDTSQSVKDTLTDLGFANNSAKNKYSEVKDKLGILAEYGDRVAWLNLWNACKREALAEGYTGQGLLKRAGERFDEITNKTQVYDSVFSRSKWMRKKSAMSKMVTSFMAEPITCANMLMDALRLAQNGQKKKAMRYTASVIASIIVTNLLSSLCDAGRDDDDDETFLEKYLSSLAANITNDMIPLNYIPGARDILSILQGYDIERMDVALISDIIDSVKSCANRVKNGKDATDELIKLGSKVGDIAGIPLTNIRREILSILNIKDIAMRGDKTTETGLQIAMREWENGIPLYSWFAGGITDSDKLYYATINGDGEYFERISGSISKELADKGKTDDEISKNIEAKIKKGLAENDIRVAAAAEARINGDTEEYINMVHKISSDGFAEAIVEKAILSVQNSLNGDEGVDSVIDGMLYTSGDICLSAEKGDTAPLEEYYQIKLDYYKDKKNEGDKNVKNPSAKALASVKSMLSSEYRKAYAQAYEDKNESECDRIRDLLCELTVSGRRIFKNSDITGWKDYDANNK